VERFKIKIEMLSTHNFFCWWFAVSIGKLQLSGLLTFFSPRRRWDHLSPVAHDNRDMQSCSKSPALRCTDCL